MFLQNWLNKVSFAFLIVGFFWGLFSFPLTGSAQSCHGGGGGQVLAVLASGQHVQLATTTSYRLSNGRFDPYGRYIEYSSSAAYRSFVTLWGAAYRLSENWQLGVSLPIIYNDYSIATVERSATSLSDPIGEIRYDIWDDLAFLKYRPSLSLYSGLRLPLGKSLYDSSDPLDADVTSDGMITSHIGATLSKLYHPLKLSWDGSFFYPFSKTIAKNSGKPIASYVLKNGNKIQMSESVSYLLNEHITGTLSLKQMWQLQSKIDGQTVLGSAGRLFSTLIGLGYTLNTSWGFSLSHENSFPFYRYLVNQPQTETFLVAGTYNGF